MKNINNKTFLTAAVVLAAVLNTLSLTGCSDGTTDVKNVAITMSAVSGVKAPVTGATPVTAITENAQYKGTVTWSPSVSGGFAPHTVYTAIIVIKVKSGYTLKGVSENFFTVEGAASANNTANSGVITAVFPSTAGTAENPAVIDIKAISGVTAPTAGAAPVTVITENTQYSGTVTWSPAVSSGFVLDTAYTATITLTAKPGYTLQGVGENFFTVEEAISVTNAADSGDVTAVFPSTAGTVENLAVIDIKAISGVTAPTAGANPVISIIDNTQYWGTVTWSPAVSVSSVFALDTVYTATIYLTAKPGYTLQGVGEDFFTVAGAETVTNAAHSHVVTVVFPKVEFAVFNYPDFGEGWLSDQPANTAATAYTVKLNNITSLNTQLRGCLKRNPAKYVILDLSGSTFTSIDWSHFEGCTNLTGITIPNSVTSIENSPGYYHESVFYGCTSLTAINVDTGNSNYSSQDGVLYDKNKTLLVRCPEGKTGALTIPDSVTAIGDWAFFDCNGLTDLTIPDSVTSIGDNTFSNDLYSFNSINVNVTWYYNPDFNFGYNLKTVIIPDSVTEIKAYAFSDCTRLTSVTIGTGVTLIYDYAFRNCTSLTGITIPDSVTFIHAGIFQGCTSLTSITIPDSVTFIHRSAFYDCTSLKSVTIGNGLTVIMENLFYNCTSLTSITIPATVVQGIGKGAFYGCTNLISVKFDIAGLTFAEGTFIDSKNTVSLSSAYAAGGIGIYKRTDAASDIWTKNP